MNELESERIAISSEAFVRRVTSFLNDASGWCRDRGLTVENGVVTLREERIPEYQAPSLSISKEGVSLARILPAASKTGGAEGRVVLIGSLARHALLFCLRNRPLYSAQNMFGEQGARTLSSRRRSAADGEGWYWIEATVLRPKRVEENVFVD